MQWFVVHVISSVQFKDGRQDSYPAWEDMYLVQASDANTAADKAEELARGQPSEITCDERPAQLVMEGARKITRVWPEGPVDGVEITHNQIEVADRESLDRLVAGNTVMVKYESIGDLD